MSGHPLPKGPVVELIDFGPDDCLVPSKVLVNGQEMLLAEGGLNLSVNSEGAALVHLTLMPSKLVFTSDRSALIEPLAVLKAREAINGAEPTRSQVDKARARLMATH